MRLFFLRLQSILFISGFTTAYAQNNVPLSLQEVDRHAPYYSRETAEISSAQVYTLQPNLPFTSLSLRIPNSATFDGAFVIVRLDTVYLQADEHASPNAPYRQANLIVLDQPTDQLLFYPATLRGEISFSFFNADGKPGSSVPALRNNRSYRTATACEEPEFVPQDEWRAGLPVPSYTRRATSVEHVIVHHSATFNNLTNYTNVVRNIYLFHTEENKWSDIGYNYLIAQDGTIYEGRSSGSQSIDNDNVQGAHFCGKNGGTMGICLLGNYNTAIPTDTAVASLEQLTAWKVDKESLDPLRESPHPANPNLQTIAGHRNGCSTACPGDNLYARLPAVRTSVATRIETGCGTGVAASDSLIVFPVPVAGALSVRLPNSVAISYLRLYDMAGKQCMVPVSAVNDREFTIDTNPLATGLYVLHLRGSGIDERRKILVE